MLELLEDGWIVLARCGPFVLESQLNRDRSSNRFMSRNVRVAPGLLVGNVASTAAAIAAALRQDALGIVSPRDRR